MAPSAGPSAILSPLYRADGSATFSHNGYTVIGVVNGPLEVGRRDELAEEAVIDVIVRSAAGPGGTRERHLESIIQSTLRQVVLIHCFPRTLVQVILQITGTPENDNTRSKLVQASSNLPILPVLLQTSIFALLSASMPLSTTLTSTFIAITCDGSSRTIIPNPSIYQAQGADSVHVLAFTSHGDLLVAESEGSFTMDDWDEVYEAGKAECCNESDDEDDMQHEGLNQTPRSLSMFVKSTLQAKVSQDLHWKQ